MVYAMNVLIIESKYVIGKSTYSIFLIGRYDMYRKIPVKIGNHISTFVSPEIAESWIKSGDFEWENESKSALILKTEIKNLRRHLNSESK